MIEKPGRIAALLERVPPGGSPRQLKPGVGKTRYVFAIRAKRVADRNAHEIQ